MEQALQSKRAFVTGGSRGIGAAIVRRLAREGADVALTYRTKAEEAENVVAEVQSLGVRAMAIQANNTDAEAVVAAVDRAIAEFGGLDILVNNAGTSKMGPFDDFRLADFDRILAVNLRAVFVATQAAVQHMESGGRIINIGSSIAERVPFPGISVYAASKAALVGLVKGLSRELGPRGITINNIQPGPVETELNPSVGELADVLKKHMALPRYASPEEVAGMVVYLAGPEAGFITGTSLAIDGGFTA